jgi:hypothetical protein
MFVSFEKANFPHTTEAYGDGGTCQCTLVLAVVVEGGVFNQLVLYTRGNDTQYSLGLLCGPQIPSICGDVEKNA